MDQDEFIRAFVSVVQEHNQIWQKATQILEQAKEKSLEDMIRELGDCENQRILRTLVALQLEQLFLLPNLATSSNEKVMQSFNLYYQNESVVENLVGACLILIGEQKLLEGTMDQKNQESFNHIVSQQISSEIKTLRYNSAKYLLLLKSVLILVAIAGVSGLYTVCPVLIPVATAVVGLLGLAAIVASFRLRGPVTSRLHNQFSLFKPAANDVEQKAGMNVDSSSPHVVGSVS